MAINVHSAEQGHSGPNEISTDLPAEPAIAAPAIVRLPEIWFTILLIAITAAFSVTLDLPFNFPSGERAAFVGIHYLYPIAGLAIWATVASIGQRKQLKRIFLIALPCYAAVLICHFNLKLWGPHINPVLWDDLYWATDQAIRPLVDASFSLRQAMDPIIPLSSNFYVGGYIAMFYISFCYHAIITPAEFRKLFLAALFVQGAGAIAYLVMPAIGPFLYEPGIELRATAAQASMLAAWEANVAGGTEWLESYGATHLTVGLAAMPSLHAALAFLFWLFAWKHGRILIVPYSLLLGYILIAAVANRWHYVIDLPIGIAIAWAGYQAAAWLERAAPEKLACNRRNTASDPTKTFGKS